MAWISDLADKAENFLNKIDKNTAAALNKDKNDIIEHKQENNIDWTTPRNSFSTTSIKSILHESPYHPNNYTVKSTPSSPSAQSQFTHDGKEESILFVDTLSATPTKQSVNNCIPDVLPTSSSLSVKQSTDNKDKSFDYSAGSSITLPRIPNALIVEVPDIDGDLMTTAEDYSSDIYTENTRLKDKLEELENELLMANHVEKSIASEQSDMEQKLKILRQEYEYKLMQQRLEIEHLTKAQNTQFKKLSKTNQKNLEARNELLSQQYTDNQKKIEILREKLHLSEMENVQYIKRISDLQSSLERTRLDLQLTRQDLEQHRARALKTLQEKEKLITELRENHSPIGFDYSTTNMELNQLRQECIALRQENQELCKQLKITREELVNADLKIEEHSRKVALANKEAHEVIVSERQKRAEAEDNARLHMEETRKLKDELSSQLNNWSVKLRKQETEISRLRSQLSAVATPSSAVESRLSTLTQTLVSKQNELENLTTEKNALRLQLEKIEHEYRKLLGNSRKSYNVNDTDDVKAQVPTFLIETPFDTSVTRRVKRAYSSLDAISVRIGRFLRSYPLARIFVIIYIGLLQFWVLVVLLFQSPDVHSH